MLTPSFKSATKDQNLVRSFATLQIGPSLDGNLAEDASTNDCLSLSELRSFNPQQHQACNCRMQRKKRHATHRWGWLSLTTTEKTEISHDPGCIFHLTRPEKREQKFTLVIQSGGFSKYASKGFVFDFQRPTSFFDPFSILPTPRTFNSIDLQRSKAVELAFLCDELEEITWDDPELEAEARMYWTKAFVGQFYHGKASMNDVDYYTGKPLPHYLVGLWRYLLTPYQRHIWATLKEVGFSEDNLICDGL